MAHLKLRQIQDSFWRSIAAAPGKHEFAPSLIGTIESSRTQEPAQRLAVYADAYLLRLRNVLAEDFPRLAKMLGEQEFDRLVRGYLEAHPSTEPSVRHVGRSLAQFIRNHDELPDYLADLAELEWARVDAFDAPDDEPLTMAKLTELDPASWPQRHLAAVRSLQVLRTAWPVHRVWAEDSVERPPPAATSIRVWRGKDFNVFHAPMDEREAAAVARLLQGATFVEICDVFAELDEADAAREAGALLLRWLDDGLIARLQ
jgi:hypothetical protein